MSENSSNAFAKFLDGEIDMDELHREVAPLFSEPAETITNSLDQRLFGRWRHSSFMSSGGLSVTVDSYLILGSDGCFIQSNQSYGGSTFTDELGNWAGVASLKAAVDSGSRGCWSAKERVLRLDFDNRTYSSFSYEYHQDSLLLYHPSGSKLYKRA